MNILKTVFAILASVLLVGTQAVLARGSQEFSRSQVCGCFACAKVNCCVIQPTSPAQSAPVASAHSLSQNNFQLISVVATLLLPAPEKSAHKISSVSSVSLRPTRVPLFQRDCSYLI